MQNQDKKFLLLALEKAKESVAKGGFPAGAIVVKNGEVVGSGISVGSLLNDPTSHGEMAAIREACDDLKSPDLSGTTLYTSMQPCLMCFSASVWASIPRIVFACSKEKVTNEYYGGQYQISVINNDITRPIELVHMSELEEASLEIVRKWENSLK